MKQPERVAWIIVAIALIAWNLMSGSGSGGDPVHAENGRDDSVPSRHRERVSSAAEDGFRASRRERGGFSGQDTDGRGSMESRTTTALRTGDPLTRLAGFLRILDTADAGSLDQVAEALKEMKASGISLPMEEELFNLRAGQLNGGELLAGRNGSAEDFEQIGVIKKQYEGWIQSDSQAASAWLNGLPAGKYRDEMAVIYIAASAKDDPSGALGMVASLHPSQQANAGRALAEKLAGSLPLHEASEILRTMEADAGGANSRYLSAVFDTLMSKAASEHAEIAETLVEDHFDSPYIKGDALMLVSEKKAKGDPDAALQWAVSMEGKREDVPDGAVVAAAIRGMTLDGLTSARQWASTQGEWTDYWLAIVEDRREKLMDRLGEENEYNKDD